jgi:GNAT superfamily N-acetyltransferase
VAQITLDFHLLDLPLDAETAEFSFPEYQDWLRTGGAACDAVVIGLLRDGFTVGLGVARHGGSPHAELLSLYLPPELRGHGVATILLQHLEDALRQRGAQTITATYTSKLPAAPAFERVLARRDWSQPVVVMQTARLYSSTLVTAHRGLAPVPLPEGIEIFPWKSLTADERRDLEAAREEVTPGLWPFEWDAPLEPATSFGLRRDRQVIGWIVSHRVAEDCIRYTSLFVRPQWRTRTLSLGLLGTAIRAHWAAYGVQVHASLAVLAGNAEMTRLLQRRLAPFGEMHEVRRASKQLR